MTRTRMLLTPMAMLARVAAAPPRVQTQTQMRCPPAVKTIWVDAQRDATSGVQPARRFVCVSMVCW